MSKYTFFYLILAVLTSISFEALSGEGEATQTDWSGGSGVTGPVDEWEDTFSLCSGIQFSTPGILTLSKGMEYGISTPGCWSSVHSADLDGDGDMDMAGGLRDSSSVVWWENSDGSGSNWIEHVIDGDIEAPFYVRAVDVDGDGDPDVIAACYSELSYDSIHWWENADGTGTSWIHHAIDETVSSLQCIYTKDIDGDNDIDVVGSCYFGSNIVWWENVDGIGINWIEHLIAYTSSVVSVYSEDLDGDGDSDVLSSSDGTPCMYWWENADGQGTNWMMHLVAMPIMAWDIKACDMDSDGDADVIGACIGNGIIWWENEDGSASSWIEHEIDSAFKGASSVEISDLDDDGDMDVLGTCIITNDEVAWWENLGGTCPNWQKHSLCTDLEWASSACVADFDGDGKNDAGCSDDTTVRWWNLNAYKSQGYLESSVLDTNCATDWIYFTWNSVLIPGTSVEFQLRASDDFSNMGPWSDTLTAPCAIDSILEPGDFLVQYRAILGTADPLFTPILDDLTITWIYMGIEGETQPQTGNVLNRISPNPARDCVLITFGLSEASPVILSIFDLSGRLVDGIHGDEYATGYHDILLDEFAPGIYFCRMISGDFTATQRFVVIE